MILSTTNKLTYRRITMFTEVELSLICRHIGKLHDEKIIERIEVPLDLVELLVDTVYEYQMKSIK